ncbi:hypothetical protein JYQ62_33630 [Nostoc sp. UHCC 0702]|nr:hypothetical protein JYQ62_33630 [Nostoc sp. UHCC 0702]
MVTQNSTNKSEQEYTLLRFSLLEVWDAGVQGGRGAGENNQCPIVRLTSTSLLRLRPYLGFALRLRGN